MSQLPVSQPPGLIIIAHDVLGVVSDADIAAALPPEYLKLHRVTAHFENVKTKLQDIAEFHWAGARRKLRAEFREKLEPLLRQHPDYRVLYFGLAPIPCAMDLGYLMGGQRAVEVYQLRHDSPSWAWEPPGPPVAFEPLSLPRDTITAEGHIILRVSLSHTVGAADTQEMIPHALGSYDLKLVTPHEDALKTQEDLAAFKQHFDTFIDWAHAHRPNADIHIFASVTVGAAFTLGTAVNPTIHSPVHAYQYRKDARPRYTRALALQRPLTYSVPLSPEQMNAAGQYRSSLKAELERIKLYSDGLRAAHQGDASGATWLAELVPEAQAVKFNADIEALAKIYTTPLNDSVIDTESRQVDGGFRFDYDKRAWQLDDSLVHSITSKFDSPDEALRAGRLLLMHEGVHLKSHSLTQATAAQIRRFPKILEELDYQADVWGFIHEWAIAGHPEPREFFQKTINTAIMTFWAFDALIDHDFIEVRRLNRYLIWYWQTLELQRCNSLSDVLQVLSRKPLVEIAGPPLRTEDNRILVCLDERPFDHPEICLVAHNRVRRFSSGHVARVADVLKGFRDRDHEKIRFALQSVFDQVL